MIAGGKIRRRLGPIRWTSPLSREAFRPDTSSGFVDSWLPQLPDLDAPKDTVVQFGEAWQNLALGQRPGVVARLAKSLASMAEEGRPNRVPKED
jgi:hypothetical protein